MQTKIIGTKVVLEIDLSDLQKINALEKMTEREIGPGFLRDEDQHHTFSWVVYMLQGFISLHQTADTSYMLLNNANPNAFIALTPVLQAIYPEPW